MEELELTNKRVLKIWWSIWWRNILLLLVVLIASSASAFLLSVVITFLLSQLGVGKDSSAIIVNFISLPLGALIGVFFGCFAVKLALVKKSFGDFRIALVPVNNELAK